MIKRIHNKISATTILLGLVVVVQFLFLKNTIKFQKKNNNRNIKQSQFILFITVVNK